MVKTIEIENVAYDVQPIRTLEELNDMKWSLKKWCSERDYILFILGINTGLRASDLLKIKVSDVLNKKYLNIIEKKTKKKRKINLSHINDELQPYAQSLESVWLFPSRKGTKPITTTQAYRQLVKAGEMVDIDYIGTHTMRKTFGYWHYKQYKDVALLQDILNHSKPSETLKYIGINQEIIDNSLENFRL